uniref:Uncharacterized protein LOC105134921 n=1 Tax=Rhizophora mucronata TaxID=61149 RepID=A0A2P2P433_RHIMU
MARCWTTWSLQFIDTNQHSNWVIPCQHINIAST